MKISEMDEGVVDVRKDAFAMAGQSVKLRR